MTSGLRTFSVAAMLLFLGLGLQAQETITEKKTIDFLNGKLKGVCTLKLKRSTLYVSFSKRGAVYREDKIILDEINPETIAYVAEEEGVVMRCGGKAKDCITRELPERGLVQQYDRIKFKCEAADQQALVNALMHLVNTIQDDDYKSTEPFE